jgi:transcriptional regulatory protein LEU3
MLRSTLLEVQVLYWLPLPGRTDEALQMNLMRTYSTSEGLIKLGQDLERKSGFLSHAPHYVFRSMLLAACTIISYLRSPFPSPRLVPVGQVDAMTQTAIMALKTCSVQADDLPIRGANVMQGYWTVKDRLPPWDICQLGTAKFKHRLGASIVFDCLGRWKKDLEWTRVSAGLDATHARRASQSYSGKLSSPGISCF